MYAWPSGSAFLLDPTLLQTVLASGTSSQSEEGTSAVAPPMDFGDGRLLETGLPGCPYRFSGSVFGWESSVWLTASSSTVSGVRWSTGIGPAPRLFTEVLGGSAGQGTSDGSGHQSTAGCGYHVVQSSDTVTVRYGVTQDVVPNDGFGHRTVIVS